MLLVDGQYLYNVGGALHPLSKITQETTYLSAWLEVFVALGELERFVNESVYRQTVQQSCRVQTDNLLTILREIKTSGEDDATKNQQLGPWPSYKLNKALSDFEIVLSSAFGQTPLFLVTPKRGYDSNKLINTGESLFPESLSLKVPAAAYDLRFGTRCLAFELLTAAAFHWHRATESVLRKYWETVLPNRAHPGNKTLGDYLSALRKSRKGSPKLKAALRDIKDLYRNPIIHPEYQVKDVDEAIALLNSIHTAVVLMLSVIPDPTSPTT